MDEALANRIVRDMAEAIAAAAAASEQVAACQARAREAGFDVTLALAAEVRCVAQAPAVEAPELVIEPQPIVPAPARDARAADMTAADRRFLKALRISSGSSAPGRN